MPYKMKQFCKVSIDDGKCIRDHVHALALYHGLREITKDMLSIEYLEVIVKKDRNISFPSMDLWL